MRDCFLACQLGWGPTTSYHKNPVYYEILHNAVNFSRFFEDKLNNYQLMKCSSLWIYFF